MEEELRKLVRGSVKGLLASIPLWLLVPLLAVLGLALLLALFPLLVVAGVSLLLWYFLEKEGVRGLPLWTVPVVLSLLPLLFLSKVSSLWTVGTVVRWFVWGPEIVVWLAVAAFAMVFLFSALKLGLPGTLIATVLGAVLGLGVAVGALGVGPSICSVSSASGEVHLGLWAVVGALVGAISVLLLIIIRGE